MTKPTPEPAHVVIEVAVTALAAGGDGVARDAGGRVTFVPRGVPGDRVRVRIVHATSSFARAELVEVLEPSPSRVEPPCPHFLRGCGGCQWQQVAAGAQREAKLAIVSGALRKLEGLTLHPVAAPGPALGWRRRARFHVGGGRTGLYLLGTQQVLPLDRIDPAKPSARCPQLEPALDAALDVVAAASPPDGELALMLASDGRIAIGVEHAWKGAHLVIGKAGIVGVIAGSGSEAVTTGEILLELEPGLWGGPWDFAQASLLGNAALIAQTRAAIGAGPGRLVELYAGAGNFTRGLLADGWDVIASDIVAPARPPATRFEVGSVASVLDKLQAKVDAVVLDPPRAGAAEAIDGILKLAPRAIAYVSCDPATLARDAGRLVAAGYRATDAWPIDLMPQTSHIEVVMRLQRI
ncbi:MAG: deoxyribonuclease/rho motif-related [Deltaproteobacteria bacterium]|nr:deoxyribonuclease/rho motif-related [Deltaproteobacteria bacterium]